VKIGKQQPPRLHHIGFVVTSIDASAQGFMRCLGASWTGEIFEDPHQKVKVAFLTVAPGEAQVELVEPNATDAPVNKFLAEKGPGLHHLCYEVGDLEMTLAEMRRKGALIAKPPKPATAFGGRRIAWVLTPEKLLVEMLEIV
jgi:methylmalonyl-CoA/ethylmalonyl-CoA epimerase